MNFGTAVKSVLSQYAVFNGRARRSEYWYWVLFGVIVSVVVDLIDLAIKSSILSIIVGLAFLLPGLAVFVRRMHDIGKSGWWIFLGLIPFVGVIILIVWACQDSKPEGDKYGPSPKYHGGHGQVAY